MLPENVQLPLLLGTLLTFLPSALAFPQGALEPPSSTPAPTQKSLQEIWDRVGILESDLGNLENNLVGLKGEVEALSTQNANLTNLLLSIGQKLGALPWTTTTIDSEGNAGTYTSLAFSPSGQPAISYYDLDNDDLKYATINRSTIFGDVWTTTTIDSEGDVGASTSLAFFPSGQPAISYHDRTNNSIKYATLVDASWQTRDIFPSGLGVNTYTSLAISPSGVPAIAYFESTNNILRFLSVLEDGTWFVQTVDDDGLVGLDCSLAFSPLEQPAISYYDTTNQDLKYASFDGSSWNTTTVDSEGFVGQYSSLAFSPSGQPAISYQASASNINELKYASFNGVSWITTTVDNVGSVGSHTSLAFSPSGQPAISYFDFTNDSLKYASFNGASWITITVDSVGGVGGFTSLAFSPSAQPAISYYDHTNDSLKYAERSPFAEL